MNKLRVLVLWIHPRQHQVIRTIFTYDFLSLKNGCPNAIYFCSYDVIHFVHLVMDFPVDVAERNSLLKNQGTVYSTPGQSSNTMDLQYSGYTYQDYQHRAYGEDLGMAFGIGGIQITEIEQHLLGDSEVVGTDDAALLARVSSLHSFLDLDEGNLTKESSIVASPMISENGYFGYRSGASVELQSYNGTIPLYPSTGPSASVDLLPVHDCENLSLDPFRGTCHWS